MNAIVFLKRLRDEKDAWYRKQKDKGLFVGSDPVFHQAQFNDLILLVNQGVILTKGQESSLRNILGSYNSRYSNRGDQFFSLVTMINSFGKG